MNQNGPNFISVIVPVFNGEDCIRTQLEALASQTYAKPYEVIIVDNGSTDTTREIVQSYIDLILAPPQMEIRLLDGSSKKSSCFARNYGASIAKGDFLLFCDADDVVCPDWIEKIISCCGDYDAVGGIQLVNPDQKDHVLRSRPPRNTGSLTVSHNFLPFIPSNTFGIWKKVFLQIGGFNEDYKMGHDVDISWRLLLQNYSLGLSSQANVYYTYRDSLWSFSKQMFWFGSSAAHLASEYQPHGLPKMNTTEVGRRYVWILANIWMILMKKYRWTWVRRFATTLGQLHGSIIYRVLWL